MALPEALKKNGIMSGRDGAPASSAPRSAVQRELLPAPWARFIPSATTRAETAQARRPYRFFVKGIIPKKTDLLSQWPDSSATLESPP
jgi:hypothetical protein